MGKESAKRKEGTRPKKQKEKWGGGGRSRTGQQRTGIEEGEGKEGTTYDRTMIKTRKSSV